MKADLIRHDYRLLDELIEDEGVRMLSLPDIAAMKLGAITRRGARKDFFDIYALLDRYSLPEMLDFFSEKYPDSIRLMAIRSLCYFDDAEDDGMPAVLFRVSWPDVKRRVESAVRNLVH